ncbi:hypothetical protein GCM10009798_14150 [Nocardioides panacihumi]|uniref:HTH cro/C1-type domain-containing protein n=1 Tax=Nocardioides panacihumi TaxID=400774 RepID=A0ABN2QQ08_9ACTN
MIKNERQLRVATAKRASLELARDATGGKTEWQAYTDLIDDLSADITEYEELKEGRLRNFALRDLDALGDALIKARIARGWTHRQLAEQSGVSEQQVQKDEARGYENAGLARLAEILDLLDFEFTGTLRRKGVAITGDAEDGASFSTSVQAIFSTYGSFDVSNPEAHALLRHASFPMARAAGAGYARSSSTQGSDPHAD